MHTTFKNRNGDEATMPTKQHATECRSILTGTADFVRDSAHFALNINQSQSETRVSIYSPSADFDLRIFGLWWSWKWFFSSLPPKAADEFNVHLRTDSSNSNTLFCFSGSACSYTQSLQRWQLIQQSSYKYSCEAKYSFCHSSSKKAHHVSNLRCNKTRDREAKAKLRPNRNLS